MTEPRRGRVAVVAVGASSALGRGARATTCGEVGHRARGLVRRDEELVAAKLAKPFVARVPFEAVPSNGVDRARELLQAAIDDCVRELDASLPGWRRLRVGAAIGTSSGGMRSFEEQFGALRAPTTSTSGCALDATYIGPFARASWPVRLEPATLVLGACASATIAVGIGRSWLLGGRCDVVLAGGFDAISVFVAAGFEALRATTGERGPRPFRLDRDGLALGEGAALVALVREDVVGSASVRAWVSGFGVTCDASHLTAPERSGGGLARAIDLALSGGPATIDLVSAHGTATAQNDEAEAATLALVRSRTGDAPVFSFKGTIGHALGAAGVLEMAAAMDAMARGVVPGSHGEGPAIEGVNVRDEAALGDVHSVLKISSAFGGANAALVLTDTASRARSERASDVGEVFLSAAVRVESGVDTEPTSLSLQAGYPADRLARADELVRLAVAAVAKLAPACGSLAGAGVIAGHGLATIETNAKFLARIVSSGVSRAEPRRFAYTTPNAPAGECAVAFGLTGPTFAVGGGPCGGIEAIDVAAELVRAGAARQLVVVAVDEAGEASARLAPGTKSGAIAVLVHDGSRPELRAARLVASTTRHGDEASGRELSAMHAWGALEPLLAPKASGASEIIEATSPWGGFAKMAVIWL